MLISTLASMAVSGIMKGIGIVIDAVVHGHENAIERGNTANTKIQDEIKDYNDKVSKTEQYESRYNELRKGVNISGNKIDNVSLSNDEF
jgi:cell shape-determining protein MreC